MPAFGLLVIVLGIWVLINTINGNLLDVVEGKAKFNFSSSPPPTTVDQIGAQAQKNVQTSGSALTSNYGAGP